MGSSAAAPLVGFNTSPEIRVSPSWTSKLAPSNVNYGYLGKPYFKPEDCCGATPPWDAFWFVIPWEAYMRSGDRRALEKVYPAMRLYLDQWIPRWTGKDGDAFAHTLPWIETAIGLMLILGLGTRYALIIGGLMMTCLTFGTMFLQNFDLAWLQLTYAIAFFLLVPLHLLRRRPV